MKLKSKIGCGYRACNKSFCFYQKLVYIITYIVPFVVLRFQYCSSVLFLANATSATK